jgi:hypothetical protein
MNCKPGDLAVIVRTERVDGKKYIGRIVRCLHPILDFGWIVEPNVPGFIGVHDRCLKPIRDNDGDDETLTWAPRRQGVEA